MVILKKLFADDTSISIKSKNLIEAIVRLQSNVENWFISNRLCLNITKTETMIFSLRERD